MDLLLLLDVGRGAVEELLREHDADGDGELQRSEFIHMIMNLKLEAFLEKVSGVNKRDRSKLNRSRLLGVRRTSHATRQ